MNKPTINQLAEMMGPPIVGSDTVTIPGYGQVRASQAKTETIARLRMIADALEADKNIPSYSIDLTIDFLKSL